MKIFLILLVILVVAAVIALWYYNRVIWRCRRCGLTFRMPFNQYLIGLNIGIREKKLYCPYCKKKTECRGELTHEGHTD